MTPCYLQRGGSGRILGTKGLFGCVLVEGSVHFTLLWLGSESLVDSGGGGVAIFNRGPWVQWIPTLTKFGKWANRFCRMLFLQGGFYGMVVRFIPNRSSALHF